MKKSYEEIREIAVDVLTGRIRTESGINQYGGLERAVSKEILRRQGRQNTDIDWRIEDGSLELIRDVFWDLFRQGHITLGYNNANPNWPFFRLSHNGRKSLASAPYRFTDSGSYIEMVVRVAPKVDEATQMYLAESVQCYYAECFLASAVMLGVAAESLFNRMLSAAAGSQSQGKRFAAAAAAEFLGTKINKFHKAIIPILPELPRPAREDLEGNLLAIHALLRQHRNDSGHPKGIEMSRDQAFTNLHLFAPFAKKLEQLEDYFLTS